MSTEEQQRTAENDALIRRIADCLERHLPDYGFDPYRYPSGENKGVDLIGGNVILSDANGTAWRLTLTSVIHGDAADAGPEVAAQLADLLAARDRRVRAEALREAADEADSIGHHWSGAPALAFFALAGDLRARIEADQ